MEQKSSQPLFSLYPPRHQSNSRNPATEQDPADWTTGGEQPTDKQAGFLASLAKQTGERVQVEGMNKGEASAKIEDLLEKKDGGQTGAGAVIDRSEELKGDVSVFPRERFSCQPNNLASQPFPEDANGNAIGAPGEPTKQPGDSDYLAHPEQWTTGRPD